MLGGWPIQAVLWLEWGKHRRCGPTVNETKFEGRARLEPCHRSFHARSAFAAEVVFVRFKKAFRGLKRLLKNSMNEGYGLQPVHNWHKKWL